MLDINFDEIEKELSQAEEEKKKREEEQSKRGLDLSLKNVLTGTKSIEPEMTKEELFRGIQNMPSIEGAAPNMAPQGEVKTFGSEFERSMFNRNQDIKNIRQDYDKGEIIREPVENVMDMTEMVSSFPTVAPAVEGVQRMAEAFDKDEDPALRQWGKFTLGALQTGISLIPSMAALNTVSPVVRGIGGEIGEYLGGESGKQTGEIIADLTSARVMGTRVLLGMISSMGATELTDKILQGQEINEQDKQLLTEISGHLGFLAGLSAGKNVGKWSNRVQNIISQKYMAPKIEPTPKWMTDSSTKTGGDLPTKYYEDILQDKNRSVTEKQVAEKILKERGLTDGEVKALLDRTGRPPAPPTGFNEVKLRPIEEVKKITDGKKDELPEQAPVELVSGEKAPKVEEKPDPTVKYKQAVEDAGYTFRGIQPFSKQGDHILFDTADKSTHYIKAEGVTKEAIQTYVKELDYRAVGTEMMMNLKQNGVVKDLPSVTKAIKQRYPDLQQADKRQMTEELTTLFKNELAEDQRKTLKGTDKMMRTSEETADVQQAIDIFHYSAINGHQIVLDPHKFGTNLWTSKDVEASKMKRYFLYTDPNIVEDRLRNLSLYEGRLDASVYDIMTDPDKLFVPDANDNVDIHTGLVALRKRGFDYAKYVTGGIPMLVGFEPMKMQRSPVLNVNITSATTSEEGQKKIVNAQKKFQKNFAEDQPWIMSTPEAELIQRTAINEVTKRVDRSGVVARVSGANTGVAIFGSAEATTRVTIQSPSDNVPEVVQEIIDASEGMKQDAVHIYMEGIKSKDLKYGEILPDGSAWQPMTRIIFRDALKTEDLKKIEKLATDSGFGGISINTDLNEATIYNLERTPDEFFNNTRKLSTAIKKEYEGAHGFLGDIKLWALGNKDWGSTHTYGEARRELFAPKTKSRSEVVRSIKEDIDNGFFVSYDHNGRPVDPKAVTPSLQDRWAGRWQSVVTDAERRLKGRYWGTMLFDVTTTPLVLGRVALDLSIVVANKMMKTGVSFSKAIKEYYEKFPMMEKYNGLIKFRTEKYINGKFNKMEKEQGINKNYIKKLTDEKITAINKAIEKHFLDPEAPAENFIMTNEGTLLVLGDAHGDQGITYGRQFALAKRGKKAVIPIWATTEGKSTGMLNKVLDLGFDTMVFVQQKNHFRGMKTNMNFIKDMYNDLSNKFGKEVIDNLLRKEYNKYLENVSKVESSGKQLPIVKRQFYQATNEGAGQQVSVTKELTTPKFKQLIEKGMIDEKLWTSEDFQNGNHNERTITAIMTEVLKRAGENAKSIGMSKKDFAQDTYVKNFMRDGTLDYDGKITGVAKIKGREVKRDEQINPHPFYEVEIQGNSYVELAVPLDINALLKYSPNKSRYKSGMFWREMNQRQGELPVKDNPLVKGLVALSNGDPKPLEVAMKEIGMEELAGKYVGEVPNWESTEHKSNYKTLLNNAKKSIWEAISSGKPADTLNMGLLNEGLNLSWKIFKSVGGQIDKFGRAMVRVFGEGIRKGIKTLVDLFNAKAPDPIKKAVKKVGEVNKKLGGFDDKGMKIITGAKEGEKGYSINQLHPKVRENLDLYVEEINKMLQTQKRNRITNEQSKNFAIKYASKLTDQDLLDLKKGTIDRAEKVLGARIYSEDKLAKALDELRTIGGDVKNVYPNITTEKANQVGRDIANATKMWVNVRAMISESGRTVQIASIPMDADLVDGMKTFLKALDQNIDGIKELQQEIGDLHLKKDIGRISFIFYNWILSNFQTDIANMIGNSAHLSYEIITKSIQSPKDFPSMMKGLKEGTVKATEEIIKIAKGEEISESKFDENKRAYRFVPKSLGGQIFNALLPTTRLQMEDALFKSQAREIEKWRIANRIARRDNTTREQAVQDIEKLMTDPPEEILPAQEELQEVIKYIDEYAKYITFQSELGKTGKGFQQAFESFPQKLLVPFVRTPANIFKVGMHNTPAGFWQIFKDRGLNWKEKSKWEKENILRRALAGSMFMGGLAALVQSGLAIVTGKGADDQNERQVDKRLGIMPYHIYTKDLFSGDYYGFSYQNINPINIPLSLMGNWYDDFRFSSKYQSDKDFDQKMTIALFGTVTGMQDQSFLSGIRKFNQEQQYRTGDYLRDMVSQITLPNIAGMPKDFRDMFEGTRPIYESDRIIDDWRKKIQMGLEEEVDLPVLGKQEALREKPDVFGGTEDVGYRRFPFPISKIEGDKSVQPVENFMRDNRLKVPTVSSSSLIGDRQMEPDELNLYRRETGKYLFMMLKPFIEAMNKAETLPERKLLQDQIDLFYQNAKEFAMIKVEAYSMKKLGDKNKNSDINGTNLEQ